MFPESTAATTTDFFPAFRCTKGFGLDGVDFGGADREVEVEHDPNEM